MSSSDRRPYLTAASLNQTVLDFSADNETIKLEMIAVITDVGTGGDTVRLSDRHKYVGDDFYEARTNFPVITNNIGDWLAGVLEFSELTLPINNTDGIYNKYLPGGAEYEGFIGRPVIVSVGLAENAGTYQEVFRGEVSDVGGLQRDTSTFTLVCRSEFEKVNVNIPNQLLTEGDWPDIEDDFLNIGAPIIYGDWTTNLRPEAPEVPAYPVNGLDPLVNASLDPVDPGAGDTDLRLVVSSTPIKTFDTASVTLLRSEAYYTFAPGDITIVPATDNQIFDIEQKNLMVDDGSGALIPWIYESGDEFFLKCVGVDLSGLEGNIVLQGKDMLKRFGGLTDPDFDGSFSTFALKAVPAESAILDFVSRIWIQENQKCLEYVLSLYEQVRLEVYINRLGLWAMSSLHLDDFQASPSFTVKDWDLQQKSFKPSIDDRNNFNRAKADFAFSPPKQESRLGSPFFRNTPAITQAGREISKLITFPNLVRLVDVNLNLQEILKLASAYTEFITYGMHNRGLLLDISDEVILNVGIGSVQFENVSEPVTAKVRSLGYNPAGSFIETTVWCFQMLPFPGSTKAGVSGITGGSTATITEET